MLNKLGDIILRFLSLIGALILAIPKIPQKLSNFDRKKIKDKIDTENIKGNINRAKDSIGTNQKKSGANNNIKNVKSDTSTEKSPVKGVKHVVQESKDSDILLIATSFTSKEKEDTIFRLQVLSAAFLILAILYLFNFMNIIIFLILSIVIVGYLLYTLFNTVKVMYGSEFPAYRDFFLMYIAVGIILVLVGSNASLVMMFSFQYFPSLTIFIFAIIAVFMVFIIFRIKYHRNYTYGKVIETGTKMAYVQVEYDIRSNVKPDVYAVDNSFGAEEGDTVKLKTQEKIFSNSGNKPISIIETVHKI